MAAWAYRLVKWTAVLVATVVVAILGVRIYDSQRGLPLENWHTFIPNEAHAAAIDGMDWAQYLAAEDALMQSVRAQGMRDAGKTEGPGFSRYVRGSPVDPEHFAHDWNRSYMLEPAGAPVGAVVLLHGLTDSPYSLRHVARAYRDRGFVAVAIRLPAHGTVPAALTAVEWEDWAAATRLAVREARRRAGPGAPLHIVGFSNGGALALLYALEAIDNPALPQAEHLILVSPMVGITRFARFAGLAGAPAFLPAFAKAAWLSILPEFNPFKYNSFPVNGARQSYALTQALQAEIGAHQRDGRLSRLPPVLTFQSVLDFTVSTRAIITALYNRLPANGSELVLFDLNRNTKLGPLLTSASRTMLERILPAPPRLYATTVIINAGPGRSDMVAQVTPAGETATTVHELGLSYPAEVFSLSHVALPFPTTDALYGTNPDGTEDFGIKLGSVAARGETGTLIVRLDNLLRMSSNPFFPYVLTRVSDMMAPSPAGAGKAMPTAVPAVSDADEATQDDPWSAELSDYDDVW